MVHQGHSRFLYSEEECKEIIEHHPDSCKCCGEKPTGIDPNLYRHQIVEIPPIVLEIVEHRLHERVCDNCGEKTRVILPPEVERSGYGKRVVAKSVIDEWEVSPFSPYGSVSPVGLFWIENRIRNSESVEKSGK